MPTHHQVSRRPVPAVRQKQVATPMIAKPGAWERSGSCIALPRQKTFERTTHKHVRDYALLETTHRDASQES